MGHEIGSKLLTIMIAHGVFIKSLVKKAKRDKIGVSLPTQ